MSNLGSGGGGAPRSREEAFEICQNLLDLTGEALLAEDFERFRAHFTLPTSVETFEGKRSLDTVEALEDAFRGACDHYRAQGTTDLLRHVLAAGFEGETKIRGTYECRILAKHVLAHPAFTLHCTLHLQDGAWKIAESIYVIEGAPILTRALSKGHLGPRTNTSASNR
ncbi:MAG: hypothetical protein AAGF13_06165 [Pseudomonadota bacterium]